MDNGWTPWTPWTAAQMTNVRGLAFGGGLLAWTTEAAGDVDGDAGAFAGGSGKESDLASGPLVDEGLGFESVEGATTGLMAYVARRGLLDLDFSGVWPGLTGAPVVLSYDLVGAMIGWRVGIGVEPPWRASDATFLELEPQLIGSPACEDDEGSVGDSGPLLDCPNLNCVGNDGDSVFLFDLRPWHPRDAGPRLFLIPGPPVRDLEDDGPLSVRESIWTTGSVEHDLDRIGRVWSHFPSGGFAVIPLLHASIQPDSTTE